MQPETAEGQLPESEGRAAPGPRRLPGAGFWLVWVIVNSILTILGELFALLLALGSINELQSGNPNHVAFTIFLVMIVGAFYSLLTGIAQSLMLRRYLRRASLWLISTVAGGILGAAVGGWVSSITPENVARSQNVWLYAFQLGVFLAYGTIPAVAQALVLRERRRRAGWWVVGSAIAWIAAAGMLAGVGKLVSGPQADVLYLLLPPVALSVLMGGFLMWVLRGERPAISPGPGRVARV